ncbi:MAG: sulfurtransferase TusA family protein [Anaerolineales bacterium]|nr:sulfurtransferase TusA family protein [Anaerolineales bacterium]
MTSLKADKFLDSACLLCSLPIVKTSLAIKEIGVGQILQVIATDPGVPPDIKA